MNKSGSYVIVCFLVSDTCIFEGVVHGAFIYIYKKWYIKQLTKTGHNVLLVLHLAFCRVINESGNIELLTCV